MMPTDYSFSSQEGYVDILVVGVMKNGVVDGDFKEEVRLLYQSRLFFVRSGRPLLRKANTLVREIQSKNLLPARERPSMQDWQAISTYRPVTLKAALRVRHALERLAASDSEVAKDCISTGAGAALQFEPGDIVPSIYHVDKEALSNAREALGLKKRDLSQLAFKTDGTIDYLEAGEAGRDYRITEKAAVRLHTTLDDFRTENRLNGNPAAYSKIFGYHYERGANCLALGRSLGNIIELR